MKLKVELINQIKDKCDNLSLLAIGIYREPYAQGVDFQIYFCVAGIGLSLSVFSFS